MDKKRFKSNLMFKMAIVTTAIVLVTGSVLGYISSSFAKKRVNGVR